MSTYTVPTDSPESDGTLEWSETTLVLVEVGSGGLQGIGRTYSDLAAAGLVQRLLRSRVGVPLSAHTAPALSLHLGVAVEPVRHVEYFHDHVRVESKLFDGVPEPNQGQLWPNLSSPGLGLVLKRNDAERYRI